MDFQEKKYVIGIDLGTTNSAISFVDLSLFAQQTGDKKGKKSFIKRFNVPQLTGAGEFSGIPVLPSFLYIPGEYDVSEESLRHPWKKEEDLFAGVFARDHGAKVPSRLVSSAKSWLCHARADRKAKILPWGSEGVEKISPVEATAQYLRHIKKAWNHSVKDEDCFLENQFVVITVPASFDEAAREYTVEAAKIAGFHSSNITLIEEPLAAFYSWLVRHEHDWQNHVKPNDLILVCDVGGGTTDFTLITLQESEGSPRFERLAVGDHLILGGDNIDLALANFVESKFKKKENLSSDKWKSLSHKCREAKEKILEKGDNSVRITLKGEGRSVIAGTMAADLTRKDLEAILCQGFFPDVEPEKDAKKDTGKAIAEFGLPYEQEPAITRHIGWFLEKHRDDVKTLLGKEPMPDFILFNGGSLKPFFLQERIRASIRNWFKSDNSDLPKILENPFPDLSVALGASYYGLVKHGAGVRVGSGSPRSYYLGIATKSREQEQYQEQEQLLEQEPDQGQDRLLEQEPDQSLEQKQNLDQPQSQEQQKSGKLQISKALCIVERGLDEGSAITLPDMEFEVLTNQPVSFDIFSSSFRSGDKSGDIVEVNDSLTQMDPMHTIVRFGKKGEKRSIPVHIEPEYTEMGTLALWCRSSVSSHRWKLQFQLRDQANGNGAPDTEVFDDAVVTKVVDLIENAFDNKNESSQIVTLAKRVENKVAKKKNQWPLSLLRSLADALIKNAGARKLSPEHEVRWLNLTGFCIRPGFGDAFDEERMRQLWKIYLAGLIFPKAKQNRTEWWVFLRRIAAGLQAGQQRQFYQDVSSFLLPGKGSRKRVAPQEMVEIWMAAANMERLLVKDKVALGRALFAQLKSVKNSRQLFWALSRIGARELLYGSVDRVVSPKEVAVWIKKLLKEQWKQNDPVAAAVAQMARKTGDRTRDLDQDTIENLLGWLNDKSVKDDYLKMIKQKVLIDSKEETSLFGESLPQGLVLKT